MSIKRLIVASSVLATSTLAAGTAQADQPPVHSQTIQMCVHNVTGKTGSYALEDVRLDKVQKEIERGGFMYFHPAYNSDCTLGPIWDLCVIRLDLFGEIAGYDDAGIDFSGNLIGIMDDGTTYTTSPQLIDYCPE